MNFFIWRKNHVSFSRYLDFCIFVKTTDFKICDVFWIVSTIKMKFGQILVCCMTNISNMFLTPCWRLETSCRPFYGFIKTTNSEIWPFSIVEIYHFWLFLIQIFKKMEHWNLNIIGYWVIGAGCWIEKDLELIPSLPNCSKDSWKLLPLLISINWPSLVS